MERRTFARVGICTTLSLLSVLAVGSIASAAEYSADMVMKMGTMTLKHHIAVKGDMMRQETNVPGGKGQQIVIVRPDKKTVWMLDVNAKKYMEMPMNDRVGASKKWADMAKGGKFVKAAGTQTINGYLCDKYKIHQSEKDKKSGKTISMDGTIWVSRKLNYEMKMDQSTPKGSMSMEMQNIKEKSQPSSLFDLPKGYTKMTKPSMGGPGMGMKGMKGGPRPK